MRLPRSLMVFALSVFVGVPAIAATLRIDCQRADMMVAAWRGPLSLTYMGDAQGSLELKAPFGELTMPATLEKTEAQDGRTIRAFGETASGMPDLAALETCISQRIEPNRQGDLDSYLTARDSCLQGAPPPAAPIPIIAQIDIGIFPREPPATYGLTIEIKRSYQQKTKAPNGRTSIESFPAQCELTEK